MHQLLKLCAETSSLLATLAAAYRQHWQQPTGNSCKVIMLELSLEGQMD